MDTNNEDVAVLVAHTGPLNGRRWPLRDSLVVGRDPTCDIMVPDRQVSRHHARFTLTPAGVLVEDMGSKNGTHFNGLALDGPRYLQDGDVIQIALAQQFVFLSSDATIPLSTSGFEPVQSEIIVRAGQTVQRQGKLRLEKRSRRVWIGEKEVLPPLSVSQFHLLELLYESEGRVVSRQELIREVWGEEQAVEVSEQALDALVRRLRDRLASADDHHNYVVTVRGHGLRLDNSPSTNL